MTIEEKAEAYDKVIKVIKDNLGALNEIVETGAEVVNIQSIQNCLYKAFPELKESNDERIRKEILNYIDKSTGCKRWVAWLEKQEDKEKSIKKELDCIRGYREKAISRLEELERQRLQKPSESSEELIQDSDKPKFNVRDWVTDDNEIYFQIVSYANNMYKLESVEGTSSHFNKEFVESKFRLWVIEDAKEGDVLVDSLGNVCIYQEPSTKLMYHSHCYGNHKFFIPMVGSHEIVGSYPATKEQRDQFGKAMADSGYVFDFDKKELKKIEDEEYDGDDYGIDSLWHARRILKKTLGKVDGYQSDDGILEHKCAISAVDKLYKQKPAEWSEEDEHWRQKVIDFMKHPDLIKATPTLAEHTIDWVKSLKDRVGNFDDGYKVGFSAAKHNQWKPSDEQVEVLSIYAHVHDVLASLYHDLKKLKG